MDSSPTSPRDDIRKSDVMIDKVDVQHNEEVLREADRHMSPMKCLWDNPKVLLWTIYANCK